MIVADFETTGLNKASLASLDSQPHITEVYAVKLDSDYNMIAEVETFIKPPIPIPEEITRITGITDDDVRNAPSFIEVYPSLCNLFLGETVWVCHNMSGDQQFLLNELRRIEKQHAFPWPYTPICTVEMSYPLCNKRLKLSDLYHMATGKVLVDAHRAKNDVLALVESYKWLTREKGRCDSY